MSDVTIKPWNTKNYLQTLNIQVGFVKKTGNTDDYLDVEVMTKLFKKMFESHVFSMEQVRSFSFPEC